MSRKSTLPEPADVNRATCMTDQAERTGLIAGALLETAAGWLPVENLMRGDEIYTYDGGLRTIERLDRQSLDATVAAPDGLVHIAGGVLSNCDELLVLPHQKLLIETAAFGGVATLVKAADLVGQAGISRCRAAIHVRIIRPVFDTEEVLWANAGLLFHCAGPAGRPEFFPTAARCDLPAVFGSRATTRSSLAA